MLVVTDMNRLHQYGFERQGGHLGLDKLDKEHTMWVKTFAYNEYYEISLIVNPCGAAMPGHMVMYFWGAEEGNPDDGEYLAELDTIYEMIADGVLEVHNDNRKKVVA